MKHEFGDCTRRLSLCLPASKAAGGLRRSTSCERTCARSEPNVGVRGQFLGSHTPCTDRSFSAVPRACDAHRRPRARASRTRITNHPSTILRPPRGRRIGPHRVAIVPRHATRVSRRSRRARARIAPHARIPRRAITHLHHDYRGRSIDRTHARTHAPSFVFVFYVAARKGGSARARRRDACVGGAEYSDIRRVYSDLARRAPIVIPVHGAMSRPCVMTRVQSITHNQSTHAHGSFVVYTIGT